MKKAKGQIYTIGSNADGRLGIGSHSLKQSSAPCLVESCARARCVQVSCGWGHTVAIMGNTMIFTAPNSKHILMYNRLD